jgi:hypothetical protein
VAGSCAEGTFRLSADVLWAAVRDFGDVSWLPGRPTVSLEGDGPGMIRTIDTPPIPTVREQLDTIDDESRSIVYRVIEGIPMPVNDYRASMQVVDAGEGRSRLIWSSTWEPDGITQEEAAKVVANMYTSVIGIMKTNLEKAHAP